MLSRYQPFRGGDCFNLPEETRMAYKEFEDNKWEDRQLKEEIQRQIDNPSDKELEKEMFEEFERLYGEGWWKDKF
jgi:hypothetical protein